jgi:zinc protease
MRAGTGYLAAYVRTSPETVEAAERELRTQLDRIRTEPPSDDEVARAKAYLLGAQAIDRRTNARHAWALGFYELIGVGWGFPDRYAGAVARVTPDDVLAAARRYLAESTTVVLLPTR